MKKYLKSKLKRK